MLEETPWVREAQAESQARRNVGILFDDNRLNDETRGCCGSWRSSNCEDGAWPWFPGGRGQRVHHAVHHHRLRPPAPLGRGSGRGSGDPIADAAGRMDRGNVSRDPQARARTRTRTISRPRSRCTCTAEAFSWRTSRSTPRTAKPSITSWARPEVLADLANRQSQGHLAVALKRFGDARHAAGHHAVDQGAFGQRRRAGHVLARLELSWWWYRAPIETQAMMIEAFDEVVPSLVYGGRTTQGVEPS